MDKKTLEAYRTSLKKSYDTRIRQNVAENYPINRVRQSTIRNNMGSYFQDVDPIGGGGVDVGGVDQLGNAMGRQSGAVDFRRNQAYWRALNSTALGGSYTGLYSTLPQTQAGQQWLANRSAELDKQHEMGNKGRGAMLRSGAGRFILGGFEGLANGLSFGATGNKGNNIIASWQSQGATDLTDEEAEQAMNSKLYKGGKAVGTMASYMVPYGTTGKAFEKLSGKLIAPRLGKALAGEGTSLAGRAVGKLSKPILNRAVRNTAKREALQALGKTAGREALREEERRIAGRLITEKANRLATEAGKDLLQDLAIGNVQDYAIAKGEGEDYTWRDFLKNNAANLAIGGAMDFAPTAVKSAVGTKLGKERVEIKTGKGIKTYEINKAPNYAKAERMAEIAEKGTGRKAEKARKWLANYAEDERIRASRQGGLQELVNKYEARGLNKTEAFIAARKELLEGTRAGGYSDILKEAQEGAPRGKTKMTSDEMWDRRTFDRRGNSISTGKNGKITNRSVNRNYDIPSMKNAKESAEGMTESGRVIKGTDATGKEQTLVSTKSFNRKGNRNIVEFTNVTEAKRSGVNGNAAKGADLSTRGVKPELANRMRQAEYAKGVTTEATRTAEVRFKAMNEAFGKEGYLDRVKSIAEATNMTPKQVFERFDESIKYALDNNIPPSTALRGTADELLNGTSNGWKNINQPHRNVNVSALDGDTQKAFAQFRKDNGYDIEYIRKQATLQRKSRAEVLDDIYEKFVNSGDETTAIKLDKKFRELDRKSVAKATAEQSAKEDAEIKEMVSEYTGKASAKPKPAEASNGLTPRRNAVKGRALKKAEPPAPKKEVKRGKLLKKEAQQEINPSKYKELIPDDNYSNSEEYRKALEDFTISNKNNEKISKQISEIESELEKESKRKPLVDWDDEDMYQDLIGHKPMIYTERGKKLKAELDRLREEGRVHSKTLTSANDKLDNIKSAARKKELKRFDRPPRATQKEYRGFKADDTGVPYYNDILNGEGTKGVKAYIAEMSPREYLERCAYEVFENGTLASQVRAMDSANVEKYTKLMADGEKFDTPYLNYSKTHGFGGQEGRHRAIAAYNLGIEKIPVLIVDDADKLKNIPEAKLSDATPKTEAPQRLSPNKFKTLDNQARLEKKASSTYDGAAERTAYLNEEVSPTTTITRALDELTGGKSKELLDALAKKNKNDDVLADMVDWLDRGLKRKDATPVDSLKAFVEADKRFGEGYIEKTYGAVNTGTAPKATATAPSGRFKVDSKVQRMTKQSAKETAEDAQRRIDDVTSAFASDAERAEAKRTGGASELDNLLKGETISGESNAAYVKRVLDDHKKNPNKSQQWVKEGRVDSSRGGARQNTGKLTKSRNTVFDGMGYSKEDVTEFRRATGKSSKFKRNGRTIDDMMQSVDADIKRKGHNELYEDMVAKVNDGTKDLDTYDEVLMYRLAEDYKQAFERTGDIRYFKMSNDMVQGVSIIQSESGKRLQAIQALQRSTPMGRVKLAQRELHRFAEARFIPDLEKSVPDELWANLMKAKTPQEIHKATEEIAKVVWSHPDLKATWWEKISAWRYLSMLSSPKTHIRNIIGNGVFMPIKGARNLLATGLESVARKSGKLTQEGSTKAIVGFGKADRELRRYAKSQWEKVKSFAMSDPKYPTTLMQGSGTVTSRPDSVRVFKSNLLEKMRKVNGGALEAEDRFFAGRAFQSAYAQRMKAMGVTAEKVAADANLARQIEKYAIDEALDSTYRQASDVADMLNNIRKGMTLPKSQRTLGKVAGGMIVDAVMPFTKTPINILKTSVNYSPIGLIKGVVEFAKSGDNIKEIEKRMKKILGCELNDIGVKYIKRNFDPDVAKRLIDSINNGDKAIVERTIADLPKSYRNQARTVKAIADISAGLVGTGVVALGYLLGKSGIGRLSANGAFSDSDTDRLRKDRGEQEYALVWTSPDGTQKSYTLDWAAPIATPLFLGVNFGQHAGNGGWESMKKILSTSGTLFDPLFSMSVLSGLSNTLDTQYSTMDNPVMSVLANMGKSYASQFIPTPMRQTVKGLRKTEITTSSTDSDPVMRNVKGELNYIRSGVPLGGKNLGAKVDLFGNTSEKKGFQFVKSWLANIASPGVYKESDWDETSRELYDFAKRTGDGTVIPRLLGGSDFEGYNVTIGKDTVHISEQELSLMRQDRGKKIHDDLGTLFKSKEYKEANDEDKTKLIKEVYSDAKEYAKRQFLKRNGYTETQIVWEYDLSDKQRERYTEASKNGTTTMTKGQYTKAISKVKASKMTSQSAKTLVCFENGMSDPKDIALVLGTSKDTVGVKTYNSAVIAYRAGLTPADINKYLSSDIKKQIDANESGSVNKQEAIAYINSLDLPRSKKAALFAMLMPNVKSYNNPYL